MAAKKSRVKKANVEKKAAPKVASTSNAPARNFDRSLWRRMNGQDGTFQGLQVWHPMDPYSGLQRKEFRSAMTNPYVYRASRIHTTFTTGQGYTTEIVPRQEEDVPEDQLNDWQFLPSFYHFLTVCNNFSYVIISKLIRFHGVTNKINMVFYWLVIVSIIHCFLFIKHVY